MYRVLVTFFVFILLSGCANVATRPIKENTINQLSGKSITSSHYKKPDFGAMIAGKASFAMIGAFAMIAEGNRIIRENNVDDPAVYIANKLNEELGNRHNMAVNLNNDKIADSKSIDSLVSKYKDSNYIMDVHTINWSFAYFPTDWNSYRVIYTAKLRLIDTKTKKVIAEDFCKRIPEYEDTNSAPTHDQLVDNNATGLKKELSIAADHCVDYFRKSALLM